VTSSWSFILQLLSLFIYYVSELPIIAPLKHVSARVAYNATFRYFKILFYNIKRRPI